MKKEVLIVILLLLVSFPAVKSLLQPGAFTSHDLTHHVVRQISMDKLLSEGQFPPRWSGDLASGYGYPLFLFNYPLPAILGELFHQLGFGFVDSVKAVLFISLILSVLGMFLFLKDLLGSLLAAFLGAVFYLYAPIHLIVVYVSGAAGASLGLVFPPYIFWALVNLWQAQPADKQRRSSKFLLIGSIAFAGLVLSHNITAFIFTPLILFFVIVLKFLTRKGKDNHFFRNVILMFVLGLGLSAFFWLPAIAEKQFIRYDQLMKGVYFDQFPSLRQIIYSPWGYGLSHPRLPEGGMSYQIGLIHIGVMVVLVPLLWFFRKRKEFFFLGIFTVSAFVVSIFFMLEVSRPLWDTLPFLSYIQFPVRLLIVPVFSASLVAALFLRYLPGKKVLFIILLLLVLYANRNHLGINQRFDPGEDYYLLIDGSTTSFDEDLPIWVKKIKTDPNHGKFTLLSGDAGIKMLEDKSARVDAEIEATRSAVIRFNQYYFPGWEININGKKIDADYLRGDDSGLPVFDIEKGKYRVLAEFKNTPVRSAADGISLISVVIWVGILCKLLLQKLLKAKKFYSV